MNSERLLEMIPALVISGFSVHFIETHCPGWMNEDFWKKAMNLSEPLDRSKLTKAQKSDLNRFIRHKKKDGRGYDSIAREWHREEVLNARPNY